MEKYDVIIVGAGPAGSTAAYYTNNLKVLIIDKFDFPRDKACGGGFLNSHDWHLEFANFKKIEAKLQKYSTSSLRAYWNKMLVASFAPNHFFDQIKRAQFDHLLLLEALTKSNVSFQKFNLKKIKKYALENQSGFIISDGEKEIFAQNIVGADGAYSLVSKFLGNPPPSINDSGLCLEYDIVCEKKSLDVHLIGGFAREIGYSWIFPTLDGYYVGLGMVRKTRKPLKIYLDELLHWGVKKDFLPKNYQIRKIMGGTDPLRVPKKYCTENILLCGDAMGLVNGWSGEGIYYAMKSGKIAGKILSESLLDLEKRYRQKMRPLVRAVFATPYIPPRFLTVTFFSLLFHLSLIPLPFGIMQKIKGFVLSFATRRISLPKNSFYKPFWKL
jgi:geranylgeranyl reductase family protein